MAMTPEERTLIPGAALNVLPTYPREFKEADRAGLA